MTEQTTTPGSAAPPPLDAQGQARIYLQDAKQQAASAAQAPSLTLAQQMDCVEKLLIEQALKQHAGRPLKVIEALGIGKKTLYDKVHKYGIRLDDYRVATEGGEPE